MTATYSANGHVATVKDAANNLPTVVYDPYDRVSQVQLPMPTTGAGVSNPGDYEGYVYDALNRVTSIGENGATSGVGRITVPLHRPDRDSGGATLFL